MEAPLDTDVANYDLDSQIGFRLRIALQRHTEIFFSKMDLGLTQPQYATLARLYKLGTCSQNELGRNVGLDSATMVGVVTRLRAQGYITGLKDETDRRRSNLRLTEKGRVLIEAAIELAIEANEITLRNLSKGERETLIRLLLKLVQGSDGP